MVKPEAQRRDLAWVHGKLKDLVFNSGCQSWWMDPTTKKNTFIYPDPMFLYWFRTIFPRWSDFEVRRIETPKASMSKIFTNTLLSLGVGSLAVVAWKDPERCAQLVSHYLQDVFPSLSFK
jgi:hypothetical protein